MKKKIMLATVTVALLLRTSVYAEERFDIRNGIYLGDSFEDVLEKNDLGFQSDDYENYEENDEGFYYVWTNKARVAGIDDTEIRYAFSDRILVDVDYQFPAYTDKDSVDAEYSTLSKALTRKYGSSLGNTGGNIELISTQAIDLMGNLIGLYRMIDGVGDFRNYDEWKYTELDDYNVKIDIVSFYYGASYGEAEYRNLIGYKMYTDEDEQNAFEKKMSENAEVENDL